MTDQEFFQKCDNLERRIKRLEIDLGTARAKEKSFKAKDYHYREVKLWLV